MKIWDNTKQSVLQIDLLSLFSRKVVSDSLTPWTATRQASLSFTISWRLLKFMSIGLVMPSNHLILCRPLLLQPSSFPASGSFTIRWFFVSDGQSIVVSAPASVLPVNNQGWFPLGLTGLISLQPKGFSRAFFSTTIQKHQFFSTQPTTKHSTAFFMIQFSSVHDYWKNHSFDYMDLLFLF